VIGGGMPVGAFGGKRAIMEKIAPLGPVYQAGTLSGNPVAVAAGWRLWSDRSAGFYERLSATTKSFVDGLAAAAKRAGVSVLRAVVGRHVRYLFRRRVPETYDA
jgi:glutamate-1-semialdehyde 2,1-aminomutase